MRNHTFKNSLEISGKVGGTGGIKTLLKLFCVFLNKLYLCAINSKRNIMKLRFVTAALLAGMTLLTVGCNKEKNEPETPTDPYLGYKNLDVKAGNVKEIANLKANTDGEWVYYSLTKGVVEVTTATPTVSNWDVAFSRYHVKTNSGTSGKGQGGAVKTVETDFSNVATASVTASYTVDKLLNVSSFGGGKPGQSKISASPIFEVGHGEGFWNMLQSFGVVSSTIEKATKGIPNYENFTKEQKESIINGVIAKFKPSLIHNNGWLTMDYAQGAVAPTYKYNNWVYEIKTHDGKFAKIQLTDYKNQKNQTGYVTFKYALAKEDGKY